MMIQKVRNFRIKDSKLLERAYLFLRMITEDLPDFQDFSPQFDQDFIAAFSHLIEEVQSMLSDSPIRAIMAQKTDRVKKAMLKCAEIFRICRFFVRLAFPSDEIVQDQFGLTEFNPIRNSQLKLQEFMDVLYHKVLQYSNELIQAGFSQVKIDEVLACKNELDAAIIEQNLYFKEKSTLTANRIQELNDLWEKMSLISRVSKLIYFDNYAKYRNYLLYQGEHHSSHPENDDPETE